MGERRGRMPWREFGCAGLLVVVLALVIVPPMYRGMGPAPLAPCIKNLKSLGRAFEMYSGESRGNLYPPIMATAVTVYDCDSPFSEQPRGFEKKSEGVVLRAAPLVDTIYPEYVSDPELFMCPSNPISSFCVYETEQGNSYFDLYCEHSWHGAGFAAMSYAYTGYACYGGLENEDDTRAAHEAGQLREVLTPLLEAKQRGEGTQLRELADKDVTTSPEVAALGAKEPKVYRLREGVERFFVTDANNAAARSKARSEIWIMHDRLHEDLMLISHPGIANVLYMDGHVEYKPFSNDSGYESPATRKMFESYSLLKIEAGGKAIVAPAPRR